MLLTYLKRLILIVFILLAADTGFAVTLKIATLSPEGSMWMEKMREGAEKVANETQNRVTFKFYPGGVMGNDTAILRKIRIGQLQGGAVVGGSLSTYFPANQIYAQPFKFKNLEEVDHVRQYLDQYVIDGLDDEGFVVFGLMGGGFAYIMSQEPIETVQDLRNRKVWIPDNDKISQNSMQIFGVTPIPLPIADVRTSLQAGLIDTVATSPMGAVVLQWHTQIKYVTNLPLIFLHAVLAIEKKKYLTIAGPDRDIVTRIMTAASKQIDTQNREDDTKAIEVLKKRGITFITPTGQALDEWYEIAGLASKSMVDTGILPRDLVEQMDTLLAKFHSQVDKTHAP